MKLERRSFYNLNSIGEIFRVCQPARFSREGAMDLKTRCPNIELPGDTPQQPSLAASNVEDAHSVANPAVASGQIQLLLGSWILDCMITLDRFEKFKKVHFRCSWFIAELNLPREVTRVPRRLRGAQQRLMKRSAGSVMTRIA